MTAQYNNLSGAEAKSGKQGAFLAAAIADTSKQLSEAEQELGNYHRQVGNYEVATKGLKNRNARTNGIARGNEATRPGRYR